MQRHEIRPGWGFWLLFVVTTPITFLVAPIALLASMRRWPRLVDSEGLELRNGTRIPWKACTNMVKFPNRRYELVFGATTVPFPGMWIAGGKQIAEEIAKRLGVSWKS